MGAFLCTRIDFLVTLGKYAGYKSGLVVTRAELIEHLPDYSELLEGPDDERLRLRAKEYEEVTSSILYKLGQVPEARVLCPPITMYHRYKYDPTKQELAMAVVSLLHEMFPTLARDDGGPIDVTRFVDEARKRFGHDGFMMAMAYYALIERHIFASPWSPLRRVEWKDAVELRGLFVSESLETLYGTFLDQRYIDYLAQNFESIDSMNWRKFEGLTCEFFEREGYHVEIGKGRDDDNIDARIWKSGTDASGPPLLLVQCKRQKADVGKVVVKALWADMQEENVPSGLIVTTSRLAPGAQKVATARSYPISHATKPRLREWLDKMRTP